MAKAKERLIFSNYDPDDYREDAIENCELNDIEPTENNIYAVIAELQESEWSNEKRLLKEIFADNSVIALGSTERWTGRRSGGQIYSSFDEFFSSFTKDCDYFHLWDENGHLYMECSHHDGTNCCEIKIVTSIGKNFYENWNYDYDRRLFKYSHFEILEKIFNNSKYSQLPRFAHKAYGCPEKEYEQEQKGA